jgi:hypothetical protein
MPSSTAVAFARMRLRQLPDVSASLVLAVFLLPP